ncbi:hypothetical protein [Actinomadura oligospora]|uniref:hypothetical protein n=1 Tax=Actinomadura oligospora TaxID=111804 RepID=UPI000479FEF4|nr:hypothetical protein [Actinomadura oligospora]
MDDLTAPEQRVWNAFPHSRPADLAGAPVRAEVLAALALGVRPGAPGRTPAIRLFNARITGLLDLSLATVPHPLILVDCAFEQPPTLDGAHLPALTLVNTRLPALQAVGTHINGGLSLRGSHVEGPLRLNVAKVGGILDLSGTRLANPGGVAFDGDGLTAEDGLFAHRLESSGEFRLQDAGIGRRCDLTAARLGNPGKVALSLSGASLNGPLMLKEAEVTGEIVLTDAQVGGTISFKNAHVSNPGSAAVSAARIRTDGKVDCCEGFVAAGRVSFTSAEIGRDLCFDGARVEGNLELKRSRSGVLRLGETTRILGRADLRHASTGVLADYPSAWPGSVRLDGFAYDSLHRPMPVAGRLQLLMRDTDGYIPQPYEHLAAVYRRTGHDAAARDVLLAKQRRRRGIQQVPLRIWGFLQDWTVGYGYRPQRAAAWLVALLALGTVVFAGHHPPSLKKDETPGFNPFLYALDLLLPIVSFGQESAFAPRGGYQWLASALTASGWILATTIIAGASRVLSRQ